MKSQTLVIDLVRNWLPSTDSSDYIHKALEYFDIAVVSYDADYPGMEKAEVKVIWDRLDHYDVPKRVDLEKAVSTTAKLFEQVMGISVTVVKHVGAVTYMNFKNVDFKNVTDFEWLNTKLISKDII